MTPWAKLKKIKSTFSFKAFYYFPNSLTAVPGSPGVTGVTALGWSSQLMGNSSLTAFANHILLKCDQSESSQGSWYIPGVLGGSRIESWLLTCSKMYSNISHITSR